jgi:hypothetical protein
VPFSKFGVILAIGASCLLVGTSCNAFIREPPWSNLSATA